MRIFVLAVLSSTAFASPTDRGTVALGASGTYATRADGSLWTWGANDQGQAGLGGGSSYIGTPADTGLTEVRSVASGYQFGLAVDGTARCGRGV